MSSGNTWICLVVVNVIVAVLAQTPNSVAQALSSQTSGSASNVDSTTRIAGNNPWMQLMIAYQNMMMSMPYASWESGWGFDDDGYDIFDD